MPVRIRAFSSPSGTGPPAPRCPSRGPAGCSGTLGSHYTPQVLSRDTAVLESPFPRERRTPGSGLASTHVTRPTGGSRGRRRQRVPASAPRRSSDDGVVNIAEVLQRVLAGGRDVFPHEFLGAVGVLIPHGVEDRPVLVEHGRGALGGVGEVAAVADREGQHLAHDRL